MKLLDYVYFNDYGHEWYFQILSNYPKFALIYCRIGWDDYPATEWFPTIVFGIGPSDLFGFSIHFRHFEILFNFLQFTPRNLEWYRTSENDT